MTENEILVNKWTNAKRGGTPGKIMEGIDRWEDRLELARLLEHEAKVIIDKYGAPWPKKYREAPDTLTPIIKKFKVNYV